MSKRPEIPGRLDVRLNVLVFKDVYTYFLGCRFEHLLDKHAIQINGKFSENN